ncbi:helix-turn-helix transcriptional regulator [Planotetraspora kaengkrachanensis]|uniref:Transcriptional regulator n=1 Tax=Planotetraspora kaengkrachanensis TaxID=575193 RepID=A0A8J3PTZ5_9ACTN|nr:transcriptional regulator [Planotetraspora kaengkrachanensis]
MLRALRNTAPLDALMRLRGHRRMLRCEEVALMAGLDPVYYTRLEQGLESRPPDDVLNALARVYDLDSDSTDHLYRVAHPAGQVQISQKLQKTVENWYHAPVFAVNHQLDVLAANSMARVLFKGMDHTDNLMRHAFLAPGAREFFPNWEREARSKVAHLRAAAEEDDDAPALHDLVDELSSESREFRRMWSNRDVHVDEYKHMRHHEIGDVDLRHDTLSVQSSPGVLLFVCHADPGSAAEESLSLLSILAADEDVNSNSD